MNKDLEKRILDVANLIYDTGYTAGSSENGFDDGYKYGLWDAWEAVRKLIHDASNGYAMIDEVFGDCSVDYIIINDSAEDVLSKIKTYENKGTCDKCIHNNKGTCNKCVHNKCNTCVHKHEDNICCGCDNYSEYENEYTEKKEPDLTEKRCIECKHHSDTHGYCLLKIVGVRCVNRDHWKPKQTEQTKEQSKQSCEDCINENTCSLKCPEHVKANGCRSWVPKQTNDQIKLGDEVIHETGSKGIVVGIDSEYFYLLTSDYGVPQEVSKEGYTKTGRYFPQIQELRNQLH